MRAVLISTALLLVAACGGARGGGADVVAGHYPLAWAAERLVPAGTTVVDLTPPGAEPHDLEVTADDVDEVEDADTVLLLGGGFQPALEDAAGDRAVHVLDELGEKGDPHVWLDPVLMERVVDVVAEALGRESAAAPVQADLAALDERYRTGLADCDRDVIVTSHEAFGRLAARYGLREESISGIEPDQEPDPKRLDELADLARAENVTTIFTEELASPRVAETLAREVGVKTATLDTLEAGGGDYLDRMDANLAALREALGCR